jgi:hypothetical protein
LHGSETLDLLVQGELGMPEGMAVSKEGNIFLSGTNGVQVRRAWQLAVLCILKYCRILGHQFNTRL